MDEDLVRVVAAANLIERMVIVVEPPHVFGDDLFVRTKKTYAVRRHDDIRISPFRGAATKHDDASARLDPRQERADAKRTWRPRR
jgi:hypothetical protein